MEEEKRLRVDLRGERIDRRQPFFANLKNLGRIKIRADGTHEEGWDDQEVLLKIPSEEDIEAGIDLNQGFEDVDKAVDENFGVTLFEALLTWLKNSRRLEAEDESKPHFVLLYYELESLLKAVYYHKDESTFVISKHRGVIYIFKKDNKTNLYMDKNRMDLTYYRGLSFENLLGRRQPPEDINHKERCLSVIGSRFDSHELLYGVKIDAVADDGQYVDVSLRKEFATDAETWTYHRHSLMSFWTRSKIKESKHTVVGFRNLEGTLTKVEHIEIKDIYSLVADYSTQTGKRYPIWDQKCCLHFLNKILAFIRENVTKESVVYEFKRGNIDATNSFVLRENEVLQPFLPFWFTED